MRKNYSTRLSGQIGEHLVVAELGRRGIIASPLAGNVPDIDLLAYANNKAVAIQVKALRIGDASVNAGNYLVIEFDGNRQIVRGKNPELDRDLLFVLVSIGSAYGSDHFYVFTQGDLQDVIFRRHSAFLSRNGGIRPRAPQSTHCSYSVEDLPGSLNAWHLITDRLISTPTARAVVGPVA